MKGRTGTQRHNLPRELTKFIGRERELSELRSLVEMTPLLTLPGTGGLGKTRLSLRLAALVMGDYSDGAWLVDLNARFRSGPPPARGGERHRCAGTSGPAARRHTHPGAAAPADA